MVFRRTRSGPRRKEFEMPMGQQPPTDWWSRVLAALRFGARIPAAVLIVAAVAMASFLLFFVMWRLTTFLWTRFLSQSW